MTNITGWMKKYPVDLSLDSYMLVRFAKTEEELMEGWVNGEPRALAKESVKQVGDYYMGLSVMPIGTLGRDE